MAEKGRSSQSIHPAVWPQPDILSYLAITQDVLHEAVAHGRYSAIKAARSFSEALFSLSQDEPSTFLFYSAAFVAISCSLPIVDMSQSVLSDPAAVVSPRQDLTMRVSPAFHMRSTIPGSNTSKPFQLVPIPYRKPEPGFNFSVDLQRFSTQPIETRRQTTFTSSSASPTFSHSTLERLYANTEPPNQLQTHNHQAQSCSYEPAESKTKCLRCLQSFETVWVALGENCHRCDTSVHNSIVPELHTAGKASKKKRVDRKKHSRMNNVDPNATTKAAKRDGEAKRRYDQAYALGVLQQTLLVTNPSLVKTAAASFGNVKCGWSSLNKNNICWDVKKYEGIDPLLYNKMDIFGTSKLIVEQLNTMIEDILSELTALNSADLIKRITIARGTLGQDKWLSPAQICANSTQS
jgi:hypothetical protein